MFKTVLRGIGLELKGVLSDLKYFCMGLCSKYGLISVPVGLISIYLLGPAALYSIPLVMSGSDEKGPGKSAYWVLNRLLSIGVMGLCFLLMSWLGIWGFYLCVPVWCCAVGSRIKNIWGRWTHNYEEEMKVK